MSQAKYFFDRIQSLQKRFPRLTNREQEEVAAGNPEFHDDTWRKLQFDLETASGKPAGHSGKIVHIFPDCSVLTWVVGPQDQNKVTYSDTSPDEHKPEIRRLRQHTLENVLVDAEQRETEILNAAWPGAPLDGEEQGELIQIYDLKNNAKVELEQIKREIEIEDKKQNPPTK